jgi:hypothetical protein
VDSVAFSRSNSADGTENAGGVAWDEKLVCASTLESEKENNASQARRRRCEVGDEQEESVEYWKIPDFTLRQATVFPMPHRDQRNEDTPSIDEPCHFSH